MILKIKLHPAMLRTVRQLLADYQRIYRTTVPDSVFYEMIVSLGIEAMDSVLKNKADSMEMEVCSNEN